jgi:hypothetical protein
MICGNVARACEHEAIHERDGEAHVDAPVQRAKHTARGFLKAFKRNFFPPRMRGSVERFLGGIAVPLIKYR